MMKADQRLCETLSTALRFLQRWEGEKQWLWAIGIRRRLGLARIIAQIERVLREVGYKEDQAPPVDIAALKARYDKGAV